jgi:hypothetical protein
LLFSAASPRQPSLYRFNQHRIVEPKGAGAERGHEIIRRQALSRARWAQDEYQP